MIRRVSLFLPVFLCATLQAQVGPPPACTTPADTLSRRYTAVDRFNDIVLVEEQGYLLSGRVPGAAGMYAQRVDCGGAVLWSQSFTASGSLNDAAGAVDRGDGTYWVAGGLSPVGQSLPDGTVLSLDAATGAELDRLQLGGTAADFFTSISATADGGAVLAGSWNSFGGEDAWLVRLSATGDTVWSRVVDAGQEERFNDALEIGGTYFAVGRRRIPILGGVLSQGLMARYDASGNQIWRKNGLDSVEWFDMAVQVGGGFVAAGQKRYGSGDIVLAAAAFDANGNVIWSKEYGLRGEVSFAGSIAAVSGGYILAGRRESSGEAWLLRLDLAGNVLDEQFVRHTPTGANIFTEVVPMPDGQRFAVSGFAGVNPAAVQGWLWVGRLDCAITGFDPLVDVLSLCDGDSAVLDAGSGFASYAWSTGQTAASIAVSASGTYAVTVTSAAGCTATDSVVVTVNPLPAIGLGGDTLGFCGVDSALISAPAGFASYLWSTGATTPDFFGKETGWYALTVTDAAGCTARDSVLVSILRASLQQGDTTICAGEPLTLSYVRPFRCGDPITDVEGNVYRTVKIGDQCWMRDNLATETYGDGSAIPTGLSNSAWQNTTSGAFAVWGDNPANKGIYGLLYNWYAVADPRSICPAGWHVPTDGEWTELTDHLGGEPIAGGPMKTTGTLGAGTGLWNAPNTGATNSSGFSGLPGGYRDVKGNYNDLGNDGYWWSATKTAIFYAWIRELVYGSTTVLLDRRNRENGFSVRCVRDE